MIAMVNAANDEYLSKLSKEDSHGLDSTVREYRALRERFYGGNAYNFMEGTLLRLADKIFEDPTKRPAAFEIVRLNLEQYPSFPFSYAHPGSWYDDMNNIPLAVENYKKALSFIPNNEFLKKRIAELEGQKK
jgi:hypothetical protein